MQLIEGAVKKKIGKLLAKKVYLKLFFKINFLNVNFL